MTKINKQSYEDTSEALENAEKSDSKIDVQEQYSSVKPGTGLVSKKIATFWKTQIEDVDEANSTFVKYGEMIVDRFKDKRSKAQLKSGRRMNVLWANFKILKPAIYGREPIPNIDRKFLDQDPVGRISSQILERTVRNEVARSGLHCAISLAVNDYLLPGRGVAWARYEPVIGLGCSIPSPVHNDIQNAIDKILKIDEKPFGDDDYLLDDADEDEDEGEEATNEETEVSDKEISDTQEEQLETTGEQLLSEAVIVDYVNWKDAYFFPKDARTWSEVQAVGKRVYISKREAFSRFDEKVAKELRPSTEHIKNGYEHVDSVSSYEDLNERTICVYEIWNKSDKTVYWVCEGYDYLCDVKKDPLGLSKFFPVPEPLAATLTTDSITPIADYLEYQDQAIQIDELTYRIASLTKACKVAGVYNATNAEISRLLSENTENELIPVENWTQFSERGGLDKAITFLPLKEVITVLQELIKARQIAMQDLDLITGITDIQRGTSDSRETLGGIRLKNNSTGSRLSERQKEVERFALDIIKIMTEIVAKQFSDKTLIESSEILYEESLKPEILISEYTQASIQNRLGASGVINGPPTPPMPSQGPPMGAPAPMSGGMPSQGPPMGAPAPLLPMGPPPIPTVQELIYMKLKKAISLIRDDISRSYRIEVETDSTIFGDAQQERQDATEFVGSVTKFIAGFEQTIEKVPEAMPLFGAMLRFAVRKFRTGRDLESTIDVFINSMENKIKKSQDQPPPPDPKIQAQQLKNDGEAKRQAFEMQRSQQESQAQRDNDARDAQKQQAEDQRELQLQAAEAQKEMAKDSLEQQYREKEFMMKMAELDRQAQYNEQAHKLKMEELHAKPKEKSDGKK